MASGPGSLPGSRSYGMRGKLGLGLSLGVDAGTNTQPIIDQLGTTRKVISLTLHRTPPWHGLANLAACKHPSRRQPIPSPQEARPAVCRGGLKPAGCILAVSGSLWCVVDPVSPEGTETSSSMVETAAPCQPVAHCRNSVVSPHTTVNADWQPRIPQSSATWLTDTCDGREAVLRHPVTLAPSSGRSTPRSHALDVAACAPWAIVCR